MGGSQFFQFEGVLEILRKLAGVCKDNKKGVIAILTKERGYSNFCLLLEILTKCKKRKGYSNL